LRIPDGPSSQAIIRDSWPGFTADERNTAFLKLSRPDAEELYLAVNARDQRQILDQVPTPERRSWLRLLPPDDAADVIQEYPAASRPELLALLDSDTEKDVIALMAYAEDEAGGLMSPRFVRLREDATVDVAIRYVRAQAKVAAENIHYGYCRGYKMISDFGA
jgi:magnesium transporter